MPRIKLYYFFPLLRNNMYSKPRGTLPEKNWKPKYFIKFFHQEKLKWESKDVWSFRTSLESYLHSLKCDCIHYVYLVWQNTHECNERNFSNVNDGKLILFYIFLEISICGQLDLQLWVGMTAEDHVRRVWWRITTSFMTTKERMRRMRGSTREQDNFTGTIQETQFFQPWHTLLYQIRNSVD